MIDLLALPNRFLPFASDLNLKVSFVKNESQRFMAHTFRRDMQPSIDEPNGLSFFCRQKSYNCLSTFKLSEFWLTGLVCVHASFTKTMEVQLMILKKIVATMLMIYLYGVRFTSGEWHQRHQEWKAHSGLTSGSGAAPYLIHTWTPAHATFYGGDDASGTMGGACGFGNLIDNGYGIDTAAMSSALFNGGQTCGACFEIKCDVSSGGYSTKWCHRNVGSIIVTGTNLCPANQFRKTDGWCNPPRTHFDLAYPAFAKLAQKTAGIIPIQYRRVPCSRLGGLKFRISGNPWFNLVLVYNVAGGGNVVQMKIRGGRATEWADMTRNWGQIWDNRSKLIGTALSFRVTLGTGETLTVSHLTDEAWQHGSTYSCTQNFNSES